MNSDLKNLSNYALAERLPKGPLADEILRRLDERNHFIRVAAYLGGCHAANLHVAELKSISKSQRERLKSIMEVAAKMLKKEQSPRTPLIPTSVEVELNEAISRLEDHAQKVP